MVLVTESKFYITKVERWSNPETWKAGKGQNNAPSFGSACVAVHFSRTAVVRIVERGVEQRVTRCCHGW